MTSPDRGNAPNVSPPAEPSHISSTRRRCQHRRPVRRSDQSIAMCPGCAALQRFGRKRDRRFESPFLQLRVINELSPGGTAIVPRPHYDAHGASAECTDLFELAVYRPGTALESGLIAYHRAALLSDVSEEERSPGKLQELGLETERGDTWHRTPGKMETK